MKKIYALSASLLLSAVSFGQYCTGGPSSTSDSNIGAVSISGDNGSAFSYTGCPGITGVEDSTATHQVTLTPGGSYSLNVTFSTCGGNYSNAGEAWIDFDGNQVFDPSESLGTWSGTPTQSVTFNFTVPTNAVTGVTRMRVMQHEGGTLPLDPCASFTWGSVVDFGVNIQSLNVPNNITAVSAYSDSSLCPNDLGNLFFNIKNSSPDTIAAGTMFAVGYFTGNQSVTENLTLSANFLPGDTLLYQFNNLFTTANGANNITLYVSYTLDTVNTDDTINITVTSEAAPIANNDTICVGDSVTLTTQGFGSYIWYDNNMNQIGTGSSLTVGPLNASTQYYVSFAGSKKWFIDTAFTTGYAVEHNSYTGDDRGGIAVTQNYVYINGDNNCVRFDVDMTNPLVLPQNDGIFSDLFDGQLYSLFDTATMAKPVGSSITTYSVSALLRLDDQLNTIDTILLSQAFDVAGSYGSTSQAGIYAGSGYVIVYTGTASNTFYHISLPSGVVTNLGTYNFSTKYANENWAHWGVADSIGGDYYVVYRSSAGSQIDRLNLTTFTTSTIQTFTSLSDMASITYSPWLKRIYFHYEGSGQFGGSSETGGYIEASHIALGNLTAYGNCLGIADVEVQNPQVNLGPDTIVNPGYVLDAGAGFQNYYWSTGETTQTITVTGSGAYSVTVITSAGCVATDAVYIIITSIEELAAQFGAKVYPNPSQGEFTIQLPNSRVELTATITDMTGKAVYTQILANQTTYQINLTGLAKGVYFLNLSDGQKSVTQKLIIK